MISGFAAWFVIHFPDPIVENDLQVARYDTSTASFFRF
jgi:hypothetical protein